MINLNLVLSFLSPSIFFKHIPFFLKNLLFLILLQSPLKAQGLADTGQILCNTAPSIMEVCSQANTGDNAFYPDQDGRYGRDAAAQAGVLVKIGGGHAGFDYTKVCNSGEKEGSGACPINPSLGNGDNNWGCTYDNITERLWEVKTSNVGLRLNGWTYSWYNTDNDSNGGDMGAENKGSCVNSIDKHNCDTEKYTAQVNAVGLCGFNDWRLPQPQELEGIINLNTKDPAIDIGYFPNTKSGFYLSSVAYSILSASCIHFYNGKITTCSKGNSHLVRLVRGGLLFNPLLEICDANNANENTFVSTPSSDFIQNGAVVRHKSTGLTWSRCSLGGAWDSGTNHCTNTGSDNGRSSYSWKDALKETEIRNNAHYLGFSDWRLPNFKELGSILETCGKNRAINQVIFPDTESVYWSASSYILVPTKAWNINFNFGYASFFTKSSLNSVRLVRGKQSFDLLNPVAVPPSLILETYKPPSLISKTYNNNHLFELAENKFPEFFTPSKSKTLTLDNWEYRYYSRTDTYLGILSENETYVLGDIFGSEIVKVGLRNELIDILIK